MSVDVGVELQRRVPVPSKKTVVYLRGTSAPLEVGAVIGFDPEQQRHPRLLIRVFRSAYVPADVSVKVCRDVVALIAPDAPGGYLTQNTVVPADRTLTTDADCDSGGGA